jgi:hypothetical protein
LNDTIEHRDNSIVNLKSNIVNLVNDTARLHGHNQTLQSHNTQLVSDTVRLHGHNQILQSYNAQLVSDTVRLHGHNQTFQSYNAQLVSDTVRLHGHNQILQSQNVQLVNDTVRLYNLVLLLNLEIDELHDSIKKLLQRIADCENHGTSNAMLIPQEQIQVFPNPVSYELRIINYEFSQGDLVELFDMNGRRVFSQRANNGDFSIDMTAFQSGNYILRIGNRVARVVKQ